MLKRRSSRRRNAFTGAMVAVAAACLTTVAAGPAQAGPIGINPDCGNRSAVQTKTQGLTMIVWFYQKDYHVAQDSTAARQLYKWSYKGNHYSYEISRNTWVKSAGTLSYTCQQWK